MGRQLVIFLDGTGNRFSHKPTNVIRLLRSLPKDREDVLTYYDQGVGTFGVKETLLNGKSCLRGSVGWRLVGGSNAMSKGRIISWRRITGRVMKSMCSVFLAVPMPPERWQR